MLSGYPMNGPFDASGRCRAVERLGIVRAAHFGDCSRRVLDGTLALDDVAIPQTDFTPRRQPEELLRWRLHEVVMLDVEHARKRNAARAGSRIFRVVDRLNLLDTSLRIVFDDEPQRPQHSEG